MVLVLVASPIAWIAAGDLGGAPAEGLRATEVILEQAAELAATTNDLAVQLQQSVSTVASGMGSVAEAMDHTIAVSKNVRELLGTVASLGGSIPIDLSDLTSSLQNTEASLLEVQGGMDETKANLTAVEPTLTTAIDALARVPAALQDAHKTIAETTKRLDRQIVLWRAVIVLGAVALVLMLVSFERLVPVSSAESAQP